MTDDSSQTTSKKSRKSTGLRKSARSAASSTGQTARDLAKRAGAGIEANPVAALVGGAALGALAGAFVPRTDRETQVLGSVGKRITDTARDAIDTARDTAKSELEILGLTRGSARDQVSKVLQGVVGALASAGTAALVGKVTQATVDAVAEPAPKTKKPAQKAASDK